MVAIVGGVEGAGGGKRFSREYDEEVDNLIIVLNFSQKNSFPILKVMFLLSTVLSCFTWERMLLAGLIVEEAPNKSTATSVGGNFA